MNYQENLKSVLENKEMGKPLFDRYKSKLIIMYLGENMLRIGIKNYRVNVKIIKIIEGMTKKF